MTKFFRVKQDTFMWKEGAILQCDSNDKEVRAIEDVWDATPVNGGEYISLPIIEHPDNAQFFERVYKNKLDKLTFITKEELKNLYQGKFKE